MTETQVLQAAIGSYPHTRALKSGAVRSDRLRLVFAELATVNRAFAPMVRELRYDVSEMAIATFLQARAYDKPLVLLPVVLAARFQEAALMTRAEGGVEGPAGLAGRRVGVRAYSQTTGVWVRGILADDYGVRPEQIHWVTFEDAHVAEYRDPPWAERAPAGADLLDMLRQGALDAVIVGNDKPDDPAFRPVFADPAAAAEAFWQRHRFVPVNHLVTVTRALAEQQPDLVAELVRLFREAMAAVPAPAGGRDPYPFGRAALAAPLALALRYSAEQGLLPHAMTLDQVWEGLPAGM